MTHNGRVRMSVLLSSLHLVKGGGKADPFSFFFFFKAGNDVKDIFASAKSGEQYRALKIVIEDGKQCSRVLEYV